MPSSKNLSDEIGVIQTSLQRLLVELPRMQDSKKLGEKPVCDDATRLAVQDVANFIRKDVFTERKADKTQSMVGSAMGVIALISAMIAILNPMNNAINDIRKQGEASSQELLKRIERLEANDSIDKNVNGRIEVMYDVLMKGRTP